MIPQTPWRMGVDLGSTATKGVLLAPDGSVAARVWRPTGDDALSAAVAVRDTLLRDAGGPADAPLSVVATGYGRALLPWADRAVTEITCHARGAYAVCPDARLVVDVGGQDAKAIRLGVDGGVLDFAMNDRCAAGTGGFLDVMARRFGGAESDTVWTRLVRDDPEGGAPSERLSINQTCVVFAESEVVGLVARGTSPSRVLWAVARAAASRIALLARQVGGGEPGVFCGGGACNPVLARALEESLGFPLAVADHAPFTGALGAALLA